MRVATRLHGMSKCNKTILIFDLYKRVTVNITILLIETYFPYVFIYKMHINIDHYVTCKIPNTGVTWLVSQKQIRTMHANKEMLRLDKCQ